MMLFQSLRSRAFALLWSGQTISRLGDGLFAIALSWWVLEKTGSAVAMGFVQVFTIVPRLIFLLIGGVLADRLPRLRVMLASDALRGLLLVVITLLAVNQTLQIWEIYAASLVFGFVDAFFQPAYAAVVPDVVPGEELRSANSLTALSGQFAGIIGPALGGVIVAAGGTGSAFGLDGFSFFVAAACVLPIVNAIGAPKRKTDAPPPNVLRELREGLAAILASQWLWITILLAAFANVFLSGPISVALPFLIKDNLQAGAGALGAVFSFFSIGAILGAVVIGRTRKMRHRGPITYLAWLSAGLAISLVGISSALWMIYVLAFLAGAGLSAGQLIWTNVLQELVPQELLGRVSSVDQFGSFALLPLSYGLTGWVTQQIGAPATIFFGGMIAAALTLLGLLHPAVRNLD